MKNIKKSPLKKIVNLFKGKKILVVGDLMIDEYIWGNVSRISPEAPIPVVEVSREELKPGGAANVIINLIAMGAKVYCAGVVGADANAHKLEKYFKEHKVDYSAVVEDAKRPTTIKTRVIAHNQQVVRIDKEKKLAISPDIREKMLEKLRPVIKKMDGIILSDYNKGMMTKEIVDGVMKAAAGKIVAVDPKPQNMELFKNATLITPNKKEASGATGIEIETEKDILNAGNKLKKELNIKAVLITRGEDGMSLFEDSGVSHVPTVAREVFDVTGAGDTVISVATLALCAGADFKQAAVLSNVAAGISVAEVGVYAVKTNELISKLKD
ncbi:MAG TPA: D-glycero-beta-D-manno-heptose-7-phosphate kinase [Candidatus Goldiibacteriota bacterium]|nr:D-glycero-beta-D-manno-heptose-7-phosphate kinase [Candidatus Goldiibacteriota bacterium]